jgi:hypothetical protein
MHCSNAKFSALLAVLLAALLAAICDAVLLNYSCTAQIQSFLLLFAPRLYMYA